MPATTAPSLGGVLMGLVRETPTDRPSERGGEPDGKCRRRLMLRLGMEFLERRIWNDMPVVVDVPTEASRDLALPASQVASP